MWSGVDVFLRFATVPCRWCSVHVILAFSEPRLACCRAINPLCTDVPLLEAGWEEGRAMVQSLFAPSASPQCNACADTLQPSEGSPALAQAA